MMKGPARTRRWYLHHERLKKRRYHHNFLKQNIQFASSGGLIGIIPKKESWLANLKNLFLKFYAKKTKAKTTVLTDG